MDNSETVLQQMNDYQKSRLNNYYKPNIRAGTSKLISLLDIKENTIITIPNYQRPYVWNVGKIETLINDLKYHLKESVIEYYFLGSVLFFNKNNQYEIIDGQQRLTTFLLIDYICNQSESLIIQNEDQLQFHFNSPISKENITLNKNYLKNNHQEWLNDNWNKLKLQIVVSVIITNNQDDAFTFFETQNNRGKKLSSVDYLKSYHLRELKGDLSKQRYFATRWDKNNNKQFLNILYTKILWRTRNWKGKNVYYGNQEGVLSEFQKRLSKMDRLKIKIYPSVKNKLAKAIEFTDSNGIRLLTSPISLEAKAIDYPFAIRQPLEKGIGFFLYTEKYNDLYRLLFYKEEVPNHLVHFRDFYQKIYINAGMSNYFVEFFRLACIVYYDKFENEKFYQFVQYLDYLIGVKRISLSSVVAQTPIIILRDNKQNLLDVISNAFDPFEVFSFIKSIADKTVYEDELIVIDNKVRGRYKNAVLQYYKKEDLNNLAKRLDWIL